MAVKTTLRDEIGDFTAVPNDFLEDKKQKPESRIIFIYLRYHTNRKTKCAFPGYDRLIKETGLSRQKVALGIKVLEATGWLVKHKKFAQNTDYELRYPAHALSSTMELRQADPLVPPRNSSSSTVEQPPLNTDNKIEVTKSERAPIEKKEKLPYPKRSEWPKQISLYFSITNLAPLRQLWPLIERCMGETPDVGKLRECYLEWIRRGYKERNMGWLDDWYVNGGVPQQGNQYGRRDNTGRTSGAQRSGAALQTPRSSTFDEHGLRRGKNQ